MSGFTFGGASNTPNANNNKALFGASTTSGGATSTLFGSTSTTPTAGSNTSGGLFGGGGGNNTGSSNIFGGASATPASSKPGGMFGGGQATAGVTPASTAPSFGGGFGGALGGAGGGAGGGASNSPLFGAASTGAAPTSSTPSFSFGTTGSSTPAASKTFSLPSTTPAGPPPGTSLFGGGQTNQPGTGSQASLFAPKPATTSGSSTPNPFSTGVSSSTPAAKPVGSNAGSGGPGLFTLGGNKDVSTDVNKSTPAQVSPATGLTLFGGAGQSGTPGAQSKPSLFGGGSTTPASTPASKPAGFGFGTTTAAPQASATTTTAATPLSFGSNKPATTPAPSGAPASAAGGFSFGQKTAASTAASSTVNSSTPTITSTVAASSATSAPSLLSGLGMNSAPPAASSAAASTSTAAPSFLSGLGTKPVTSTPQPTSTAPPATAPTNSGIGAAAGSDATKTGLGSSTAGPAPNAQSRLKNKSMDEIITRWAADLSKYQKEFQSQAETVARWDRALVENSDKVKQLYSKTFQAERDAAEVEKQLTMMEENQAELDSYLDRYEKEIDTMMKNHGVGGRSDGLRGPDQEREKTYKLAEKLQGRLNELNRDLTEMIEEINNTSQTLSKTGKPDDPLTKVVRVLNLQLSQLQLIDSGAAQLQEKISKAQRESHRVGTNGWNGLGTDSSDDFYRSFRGGRSDRFGGVS